MSAPLRTVGIARIYTGTGTAESIFGWMRRRLWQNDRILNQCKTSMIGEIILQAATEIVLSVWLRKNKIWRRVVWIVLLAVLVFAVISTVGK